MSHTLRRVAARRLGFGAVATFFAGIVVTTAVGCDGGGSWLYAFVAAVPVLVGAAIVMAPPLDPDEPVRAVILKGFFLVLGLPMAAAAMFVAMVVVWASRGCIDD